MTNNIGEVRRTARRIEDDWIKTLADDPYNSDTVTPDRVILSDFVKQLLPDSDFGPDGEPLPVTGDWLREVWGFEYNYETENYVIEHSLRYEMSLSSGVWTLYWNEIESWPVDIRYCHQFRQLATALGLAPRKEGV